MSSSTCTRLFSAELEGVDAHIVEVEVDLCVGLSSFTIVGLADKSVSEARERVSLALHNTGIKPPSKQNRRVTVNLAPADIKKTGSCHDLSIALGYAVASGQMKPFDTSKVLCVGELALDGSLRPVAGVLSVALLARQKGIDCVVVPVANAQEAALVSGVKVYGARTLHQVVAHFEHMSPLLPITITDGVSSDAGSGYDVGLGDIKGQHAAKRALTIAAAGGHNIFFSGPPGAGKTMLARSLVSILPAMNEEEMIDVTKVYSAAGLLLSGGVVSTRPFRTPHHSCSVVALVGGGANPRPGEISLAHRGVLFMDEIPEFRRDALEALRQPLESGQVVVARARRTLVFPARIMLVAASNPCPCGFWQDEHKECVCTTSQIDRYQKKLSGPFMDRIDVQVWVDRITAQEFSSAHDDTQTTNAHAQVCAARTIQQQRFAENAPEVHTNAEMPSRYIDASLSIKGSARALVEKALDKRLCSARGAYKILKIAQTIADLEQKDQIDTDCVQEALGYRVHTG